MKKKYIMKKKLKFSEIYGRLPVPKVRGGPMKNKKKYTRKSKHKRNWLNCHSSFFIINTNKKEKIVWNLKI